MDAKFVKVGERIVNLEQVADCNRCDGVLYVHLAGGGFVKLEGDQAVTLWQLLGRYALDDRLRDAVAVA